MKKTIIALITGGMFGFLAGAGAMLVAFPFLFPPAKVNEAIADVSKDAILLLSSEFRQKVSGQDAAHWGRGSVRVYKGEKGDVLIAFGDDFEVGAGPNFWLYVNSIDSIDDEDDFKSDKQRLKLAKIKSFSGAQVYRVSNLDYSQAKAITIWCETFNQYIASANLVKNT